MLHLAPKGHPHRKLQLIVLFFLGSWLIGTLLIHKFEQAQNWTYFDAFYFTVITTATIGFGDYIPHSVAGKILTMLYAIVYVPLFLYSMSLLFETRFHRLRKEEKIFEKSIHDTEMDVEKILDSSEKKSKKKYIA